MIPVDFFVLFGILVVSTIFCFYIGKSKSLSVLFSLYLSVLFYDKIPFLSKLIFIKNSSLHITINYLILFIAIVLIFNFLISKHIHSFDTDLSISKSIIFGLALTVFILYIGYYIISIEPIYNFSSKIDSIFALKSGNFYLLLAPLAIIFLL